MNILTLCALICYWPFFMIGQLLEPILEALRYAFEPIRVILTTIVIDLYQVIP